MPVNDVFGPTLSSLAGQPLDSDLTAIAALSTTAYGRSLLAAADGAAVNTILNLGYMAPHDQDIFTNTLANDSGGNASTSGVLHAVFVGKTQRPVTINHIRSFVTLVSTSANQIMEFGLFSTPLPPQDVGQTLTCLAVVADTGVPTNITTCLAGVGLKQNVVALGTVVPAGTYLWVGMRTAFTGGTGLQPSWRRTFPVGDGQALWTAAAGVIALGGTYVGAVAAIGTQPPNLDCTRF